MRKVANFLLFQTAWLINVLMPGSTSAILTLLILGLHLAFVSTTRMRELRFIIMAAALGIAVDVAFQNAGVLVFPGHDGAHAEGMIPVWLVTLWLMFVTTVNHCLYWMREHSLVLFGLPPFAGALAYYGAAQLGALEIGYGIWGVVAIAVAWGILFPVFVMISRWLESLEDDPDLAHQW